MLAILDFKVHKTHKLPKIPTGYSTQHEDIGKFPNCLNSIPNENVGLMKENKQNFFCKYV